jgi:HSP20 family protein
MKDSLRAFESLLGRGPQSTRWQPAADIYRTSDGWLVKVELAGVRPDEFEVRVAGPQVILRGRRRDWQFREAGQCQSLEIAYDEFERRFEFPIDLSTATIDTEYSNGILVLRIQQPREKA